MATTTGAALTAERRQQADTDGYFVVEGLLSPDECREHTARLGEYATGRRPLPAGLAIQREPRVARGALPHVHVTDDYVVPEEHYDRRAVVAIPMAPGSGLFFHSLLLHGTAANRSAMPRRAITMSYMAAGSRYTGKPPKPDYLRISGRDVPGGV